MGHLRWDHKVLRDPCSDDLRRRRLVPIDRFSDDDIACMDAENWSSLEGYYRARSDEREHLQRLQADMEENGIFRHVEIGAWGDSLFVADGHHRVQTARALGWTHLPYRWFRRERQVFSGPIRWESGKLPGVSGVATLTSLLAGSPLLISYVAPNEPEPTSLMNTRSYTMNTTSAPRLTDVRCIEAVNSRRQPTVTEEQGDAIMEAITHGRQLKVRTRGVESGHTLLGGPLREVCMTEFTDPGSDQTRYAVETWAHARKVTHDYADRAAAEKRYENASVNLDLA